MFDIKVTLDELILVTSKFSGWLASESGGSLISCLADHLFYACLSKGEGQSPDKVNQLIDLQNSFRDEDDAGETESTKDRARENAVYSRKKARDLINALRDCGHPVVGIGRIHNFIRNPNRKGMVQRIANAKVEIVSGHRSVTIPAVQMHDAVARLPIMAKSGKSFSHSRARLQRLVRDSKWDVFDKLRSEVAIEELAHCEVSITSYVLQQKLGEIDIGVLRNCCYPCAFILEQLRLPVQARSSRIWAYTSPTSLESTTLQGLVNEIRTYIAERVNTNKIDFAFDTQFMRAKMRRSSASSDTRMF